MAPYRVLFGLFGSHPSDAVLNLLAASRPLARSDLPANFSAPLVRDGEVLELIRFYHNYNRNIITIILTMLACFQWGVLLTWDKWRPVSLPEYAVIAHCFVIVALELYAIVDKSRVAILWAPSTKPWMYGLGGALRQLPACYSMGQAYGMWAKMVATGDIAWLWRALPASALAVGLSLITFANFYADAARDLAYRLSYVFRDEEDSQEVSEKSKQM